MRIVEVPTPLHEKSRGLPPHLNDIRVRILNNFCVHTLELTLQLPRPTIQTRYKLPEEPEVLQHQFAGETS